MTFKLTFRTQSTVGFTDPHLIVIKITTVTRSKLGEDRALAAIERLLRVINRRRLGLEKVVFTQIDDGVANGLCVKRRDDSLILMRKDDAVNEEGSDLFSVLSAQSLKS